MSKGMQQFFLFVRRRLFPALLAVCICGPVHGQIFNLKDDVPNAAADPGFPSPQPGKVKALKGQQLILELSADAKSPGAIVEFLIRDFPLAGTIDSLESNPKDRRKAIMKYTPKLNTAATTDVFTFSVRYPNGRWSAAVKYEIALVDAVPIMQAPAIVEFGRVMIGDQMVKEIFVKNAGNALYDRTLKLAAPWHIVSPEDGKLTLPIGGSKVIKVAYRPVRPDKQRFQFTINRNSGGMPELHAEGYIPFSFEEPSIVLQPNDARGSREGELVVLSHAPKTLMLTLRVSDRLQLDNRTKEIYLIPEKESRIPLSLPATDALAFDGTVELSTDKGFLKNATVKAAKLPGRLKIEIPGAQGGTLINLGEVDAGLKRQGGLIIKNIGGDPIDVEVEIGSPFKILGTGPGRLSPQTAQPLAISFEPTLEQHGLFDETLKLRTATQEIEVRLLAIAKRSSTPSTPQMRVSGFNANAANTSSNTDPANSPPTKTKGSGIQVGNSQSKADEKAMIEELRKLQSPSGLITTNLVERKTAGNLAPPTKFLEPKTRPFGIEIVWQAPPNSKNYTFDVELRGERFDEKTMLIDSVWVPLKRLKIVRKGDEISADIENLAPNRLYEFRVFTVNANGHSSLPSSPVGIATPFPMDWTWIYLGTGIFLALVIIVGGSGMIIKKRRASGNGYVDPLGY